MLRLKQTLSACILASVLVPTIAVHATTYYVATNGSNSNNGTSEETPFLTVGKAVDTMVAGDTTYVRGGTYIETAVLFSKTGSQSAQIKLLNYPGESPIFQCVNTNSTNRIQIHHTNGPNVAIGWITIEGFEIRNCAHGVQMFSAHDLTIRRNWIHDNRGQGILGPGIRVLIDRNVISHNGAFAECAIPATAWKCNQSHGIYMSGGSNIISNNLIYDNLAYGIHIAGAYPFDSTKYAGPEYVTPSNWIIANNTFAYENYRAGIAIWGGKCDNLRIENNIFYENAIQLAASAAQAIEFFSAGDATGITIKNNLSYANGSGATVFILGGTQGVNYTQSGNVVNTVNPAFVNAPATLPTSPNFSLTERSPAIDNGLTNATIRIAFDGTTRPQGRAYDIGAYEYKAGADAKSPAAPIALQVR